MDSEPLPYPKKSPHRKPSSHLATFTSPVKGKSDVGEFSGGYFIMPSSSSSSSSSPSPSPSLSPSRTKPRSLAKSYSTLPLPVPQQHTHQHHHKRDRSLPPFFSVLSSVEPTSSPPLPLSNPPPRTKKSLSVSASDFRSFNGSRNHHNQNSNDQHYSKDHHHHYHYHNNQNGNNGIEKESKTEEIVCYDKTLVNATTPIQSTIKIETSPRPIHSSPIAIQPPQINSSQSVYSASFPTNIQPPQNTLSNSYTPGLLTPSALKRLSLNAPLASIPLFSSNPIPSNNSYSRSVSTPDFMHTIDETQSTPSSERKFAGFTNAPPPTSLPLPIFINNNNVHNNNNNNNSSPVTERKTQTNTSLSPLILANSQNNQKIKETPILMTPNLNLSTSLPKTTPWETLLAANSNPANSPSPTTLPIPSRSTNPNTVMYTQSNPHPPILSSSLPTPHTSTQPPPSPALVFMQSNSHNSHNSHNSPSIPTNISPMSNGHVTLPQPQNFVNGNNPPSLSQLSTDLCKLLNINSNSSNASANKSN